MWLSVDPQIKDISIFGPEFYVISLKLKKDVSADSGIRGNPWVGRKLYLIKLVPSILSRKYGTGRIILFLVLIEMLK